jgi:hypothetical protein
MSKLTDYILNLFKNGCKMECDCRCSECENLLNIPEMGDDVDCIWIEMLRLIKEDYEVYLAKEIQQLREGE